jgi:outer membrane lipoprotein-sorting protein
MRIRSLLIVIVLALGTLVSGPSRAASDPTAAQIVARYDEVMGPKTFDALLAMIAHRQDGTTRSYKMRVMKAGDDKIRLWFFEPASAKGQEMLRMNDNLWVYMPNLKRALRIAARESFQGGDFNNGDVLRVNYVRDYSAVLGAAGDDHQWMVELTAKTEDASYDRIKLWVTRSELLPARAEYYAASGKLLRSAEFSDVKDFRGLRRPSRIVMRNELAQSRYSELQTLDMKLNIDVPAQRFVLDDLGR